MPTLPLNLNIEERDTEGPSTMGEGWGSGVVAWLTSRSVA